MTGSMPAAPGGALLPARPLAAQAHALRAAAAFIEHAGIPGLSLIISRDEVTIQVPEHLTCPASRTAAVILLAAAAGGHATAETRPGPARGWIQASGHIAGHPATIFTAITEDPS